MADWSWITLATHSLNPGGKQQQQRAVEIGIHTPSVKDGLYLQHTGIVDFSRNHRIGVTMVT